MTPEIAQALASYDDAIKAKQTAVLRREYALTQYQRAADRALEAVHVEAHAAHVLCGLLGDE